MGDATVLFYRNKSRIHERHEDGECLCSNGKSILTQMQNTKLTTLALPSHNWTTHNAYLLVFCSLESETADGE